MWSINYDDHTLESVTSTEFELPEIVPIIHYLQLDGMLPTYL